MQINSSLRSRCSYRACCLPGACLNFRAFALEQLPEKASDNKKTVIFAPLKYEKNRMVKENSKIKSVLKSLFAVSVDRLIKETVPSSVGHIYVQFDGETGEVQLYDEQERLLHKTVIFNWVGGNIQDAGFASGILSVLRQVVKTAASEGIFEHQLFIKPFSVSLTDEEFINMAEIYTVEDNYSSHEHELMKGLDKDLDNFLKKLLSDVE
jgi:hypothetical protein